MSEPCRYEPQVRTAAARNAWTDALRAHVASCADCSAAVAVTPFMSRFARVDEREHLLPDASVLWLKAQLLGRTAAAERAVRPLNIAQIVAYLTVAAGWAALLTWKWSDLQQWFLSFTPAQMAATASGATGPLSVSFLLSVVVLASTTVMLALHTILTEE